MPLPQVELMQSSIVNVGAETIGDSVAKACRFRRLTEMLLFIQDVVFCASNDASTLNALHSLSELDTSQDRIGTVERCQRDGPNHRQVAQRT